MMGEGVDTFAAPFVSSFVCRSPQGVPLRVVFHSRSSTVDHRVSRSPDLACPAAQSRAAPCEWKEPGLR